MRDFKKAIPKLEKDILDPKIFKEMYTKVFETFLMGTLSIDFEFATVLWEVLLKRTFKYH